MGFLTANKNRSRSNLKKLNNLRVGVLRKYQKEADEELEIQPDRPKRRRGIHLYGEAKDDVETRNVRLKRRYASSVKVIIDTHLMSDYENATPGGISITESKIRSAGLYTLPLEIIHEVFLLSGNLELPNCSKRLHDILSGSQYLKTRMVLNISSTVRKKSYKNSEQGEQNVELEEKKPENPIRVLNSKFLIYRFVTPELLKALNIQYTASNFPVNNEEEIFEEDIESVPITTHFQDLVPNNRSMDIYIHFLSQPNCIKNTGPGQSVFLNMCIQAGYVEKVHLMLDTKNLTSDVTSLTLALGLEDMYLFRKLSKVPSSPDVLSNDVVWEKVLLSQNHEAINILHEAGGNPSLHALSFGTQ